MKKLLFICLGTIALYNCSNHKEEVLNLMKDNEAQQQKMSKLMSESEEYLKSQNDYIFKMSAAGADENTISKLEAEKKKTLEKFDRDLKLINDKLDANHKKMDSLSKL